MATAVFPGEPLERSKTVQFEIPDYDHSEFLNVVKELTVQHGMQKIKCIQPLGNGRFQATFTSHAVAARASNVGLTYENSKIAMTELAAVTTVVYVKRAPYELEHECIKNIMGNYGTVKDITFVPIDPTFPEITNGDRKCVMVIKKEIPNWIKVGPYTLMIYHRGIVKTCRLCQKEGHLAAACQNVVCHRCKKPGHMVKQCPEIVELPQRVFWSRAEEGTSQEVDTENSEITNKETYEASFPLIPTEIDRIDTMISSVRYGIPEEIVTPIDPFKPRRSLARSPPMREEEKVVEEGETFEQLLEEINKDPRKDRDTRNQQPLREREARKSKRNSPEVVKSASKMTDSRSHSKKRKEDTEKGAEGRGSTGKK